jgi:hypothetical protein
MKRFKNRASNYIDGAKSSVKWGKKPRKFYKGCAGKGGATTNAVIFHKEDK